MPNNPDIQTTTEYEDAELNRWTRTNEGLLILNGAVWEYPAADIPTDVIAWCKSQANPSVLEVGTPEWCKAIRRSREIGNPRTTADLANRVAYAARDYLRAERGRVAAQNASDRVSEPGEQREVLAETAWTASCLAAEQHRALIAALSAWEAAL